MHSMNGGSEGASVRSREVKERRPGRQGSSFGPMLGLRAPVIAAAVAALFVLATGAAKFAQAQVETVPHNFTGFTDGDGQGPVSGLISDSAGNLYGTTEGGGSSDNCSDGCGTVFELTAGSGYGTEVILHSFTGGSSDGQAPRAGLIMDPAGNLYGTTDVGGSSGNGTVFELTADSGYSTETLLHNFAGHNVTTPTESDGAYPEAGLIVDSAGNLYGTTEGGGSLGYGIVYELTPPATSAESWTESVLHNFAGSDGGDPDAGLIMDPDGNLFGTTFVGGSTPQGGTVFELTADSGYGTEIILYSFTGGSSDGEAPQAGLIMDSGGNLFGTTKFGGSSTNCSSRCGTVFELSPPATDGGLWTESVLYNFTGGSSDGGTPTAGLIMDLAGNLFGTTEFGGLPDRGTVFEVSPPATDGGLWTESLLHTFTGEAGDGANALSELFMDSVGSLYGTTEFGGSSTNCDTGCGIVFGLARTPQGGADLISHQVNALLSQGVLTSGQANSLLRHLNKALALIEAGNIEGAIVKLESFIAEVTNLYNSGGLTEDQYTALVSAATELIAELEAM